MLRNKICNILFFDTERKSVFIYHNQIPSFNKNSLSYDALLR